MTGSTSNNYNRQEVQTRTGSGRLGHLVSCHVRLGGDGRLDAEESLRDKMAFRSPIPPTQGRDGLVKCKQLS